MGAQCSYAAATRRLTHVARRRCHLVPTRPYSGGGAAAAMERDTPTLPLSRAAACGLRHDCRQRRPAPGPGPVGGTRQGACGGAGAAGERTPSGTPVGALEG